MTELLTQYCQAVISFVAMSAPALLLGFLLAGLIRALIPEEKIYRHLGADSFRSVGLASLFGMPLPLCSCSVLPTAMSLKKSGASKGATTAFLISTPETGVDSVLVTYALLDPIMTVARPLGALITALTSGTLVNWFVRRGLDDAPAPEPPAASCCHGEASPEAASAPRATRRSLGQVVREAREYSFGPLLDDLTPWFVLGFLISGVIAVVIPADFFDNYVPAGWASSLLMLAVGTPIYVCAAASTPVAAALIAKGLDPGAALIFLLVGPATNAATILVVAQLLGKRILWLYLISVTGLALLLGYATNAVYQSFDLDLTAQLDAAAAAPVTGWDSAWAAINTVAALILVAVVLRSAVRIRLFAKWGQNIRGWCRPLGFDPGSRLSLALGGTVALALYLSTGIGVVRAGEVGWVLRFSRVVQTVEQPQLVVHAPWPFEALETLRAEGVRTVELGFLRDEREDAADRDLEAEAEVMTGEEHLLSLTYAVHYAVADGYRYRFRTADPAELVRAFAESALRESVAHRQGNDVMIAERAAVEAETLARLQQELNSIDSGVRVTALTLQDVHAPSAVHFAYRDVASALEDKQRKVRHAEGLATETLAEARADAHTERTSAEAYLAEIIDRAEGESRAFRARQSAYLVAPLVTRLRLFFETMEATLAESRSVYLLDENVQVELWNTSGEAPLPALDTDE